MNYLDLHLHSTFSDGTHTPQELIKMAEKLGLKCISITDHDTVSHISPALAASKNSTVEVIPGVEVSADFSPGTMHILGYGVDYTNNILQNMLLAYRAGREIRNPQIIKKLQENGCKITYEEIRSVANGETIGRPHIARVMVEKGFVSNIYEAFDLYLKKGALAYVDRVRFSSYEIINAIHNANGLAFIAHPKQLLCNNTTELYEIVTRLVAEGIDGIEVFHSSHKKKDIKIYQKIAENHNLLISGGSDFHGGNKTFPVFGSVGEGVCLGYDIVEKIKARF